VPGSSGNVWYATIAQWFLGLCLALRGELDEAEQELQATLALAHRTENPEQQVYALTWLSIVRRKRGRLEAVREYASRTLAAAEAALMPVHVGVSQANLAWVAWREGNLAEAEKLARAAVASWQKSQWAYAFQWTAYWPLLAMALDRHQIPEALDHARAMLDPHQQRLPAELEAALEEARARLQRAARLAQGTGYL
jgi:tetratricopeptide (TPR) repeat protein